MSEEEYPRPMQEFMRVLEPEEAIAQKKAIAIGIDEIGRGEFRTISSEDELIDYLDEILGRCCWQDGRCRATTWTLRIGATAASEIVDAIKVIKRDFGTVESRSFSRALKLALSLLLSGPDAQGCRSRTDVGSGVREIAACSRRYCILFKATDHRTIHILSVRFKQEDVLKFAGIARFPHGYTTLSRTLLYLPAGTGMTSIDELAPEIAERAALECSIIDDWAAGLFDYCRNRHSGGLRMAAIMDNIDRAISPWDHDRIGLITSRKANERVIEWQQFALRLPP